MQKYRYSDEELKFLEGSCIPFAAYQFINKRVVTIVISSGFCELFGFDKNNKQEVYELMDNNMYRDTHPDDLADLADAALKFATEGGSYDVIYRNYTRGECRIIRAFGEHIYKSDGTRLAFIWYTDQGPYFDDREEEKNVLIERLRDELKERSFNRRISHDYLTGLPAMTYFFELADEGCKEIRKQGKIPAILFTDFNGMKNYNHKYGLEEGDKFLTGFTKVLLRYFSHENCSRFSADHFCIYTDYENALEQAQKLLIENPEKDKERVMPLRIGIYKYDDENISISAACDRAKIACDSDKKNYRSKIYLFDNTMVEQIEKRHYVIENIDRAISEGWIKVHFQPIVRSANGKVCADEALSRWEDPEKGFLSPADFIPALEESSSIYKLDLFVVDCILAKMEALVKKGIYIVPSSVNLSRSDFYTCDIVEEIRKRVDKTKIPRDRLVIEITESAIADDLEYMTEEIKRFKELGFTVWMDDYGSGYSSPVVLQTIPFDLIKIDMLFVRQIEESEKARIIITETARMAMALNMDTIAEGVESQQQAEFLKEIGCTMLQGYYFSKSIPIEEIIKRVEKGAEIGFENPAETGYFSQLGRVNLYALSLDEHEEESLKNYFDTWPTVLLECGSDTVSVVRYNQTFKDFTTREFPKAVGVSTFKIADYQKKAGAYSLNAILQCGRDGKRVIIDDRTSDGKTIQLLIKRVAVNPVTNVSSVLVTMLSVLAGPKNNVSLSYNYIARALSEDYIYLYFVNLDTEEFTEYSADGKNRDVSVERRGQNFFKECMANAQHMIYKEDQEEFLKSFTKENIEKNLKENGKYILTYRNLIKGEVIYVSMKIVKLRSNDNDIIIGINNVDAQMKREEEIEKIREERLTYSRIKALTGEYVAVYLVDPQTDEYTEYSSTDYYDSVGLSKSGHNFYEKARQEAPDALFSEDSDGFIKRFRKEVILKDIKSKGMFTINYRLMIKGMPVHVQLRATLIKESDSDKLIMGVLNIDDIVKREQEYVSTISAIKAEVDRDGLTGVKSKHAYVDAESSLDKLIDEGNAPEFALAVFDINGLKEINDTLGHQAGDQYIIDGCEMICKVFKRSPVFRIGGDEFVVIARGADYARADELMEKIAKRNRKNHKLGKVVVAAGMAKFTKEKNVASVFKRADDNMYKNKRNLKKGK